MVSSVPRDSLQVNKPFKITFKMTAHAPVPVVRQNEPRRQRVISLVVQHLQAPKETSVAAAVASAVATSAGAPQGAWTPRMPSSGFSTPSPYATPLRADFHDTLAERLLVASPRSMHADAESDGGETPGPNMHAAWRVYDLPPPELREQTGPDGRPRPSDGVVFLGTSALFLPPLRFPVPTPPPPAEREKGHGHTRAISTSTDGSIDSESDEPLVLPDRLKAIASQEFELSYLPLKSGFMRIGGLRVFLVEDRLVDDDEAADAPGLPIEPRILKEWEVIAEVWVIS